MKKRIFIPAVLAAVGVFAALLTPTVTQTAKAEAATYSARSLISAVWNNDQTEVAYGDFNFDVKSGNVANGTFLNMTKNTTNDGDMNGTNGMTCIDWAGKRFISMQDERIILSFEAVNTIQLSVSVTSMAGGIGDSVLRYFNGNNELKSIASADMSAENVNYTTTVNKGETFYLEWGFEWTGNWNRTWEFYNSGLSFSIERTAAKKTYTVSDVYVNSINNDGAFVEDSLVSYGMTFGDIANLSFVTPTVDKANGTYTTTRGSGGSWWNIYTNGTNNGADVVEGFAFTFTAKDCITIDLVHTDSNLGFIDTSVTISYLVRRGDTLRNVYEMNNFNYQTMSSNEPVEIVPGETLYIYIWGNWAARNINTEIATDFTFNLTEVVCSDSAKTLVKNWVAFRMENPDFCTLDVEKQATLKSYIDAYDALSAEDKAVVGRTYDSLYNGKEMTINDTADYFRTYNPDGISAVLTNNNNGAAILFLIGLITVGGILLAVIRIRKTKYSK